MKKQTLTLKIHYNSLQLGKLLVELNAGNFNEKLKGKTPAAISKMISAALAKAPKSIDLTKHIAEMTDSDFELAREIMFRAAPSNGANSFCR